MVLISMVLEVCPFTIYEFIVLHHVYCLSCIKFSLRWIIGESPARADMAGGWSDTPPISYEHGGAVANVALLVDNKVSFSD